VGVEAIEAALADGKTEVADEALGDAIGLEPGDGGVLGSGFRAVEELKTADAEVGVGRASVEANVALTKCRGSGRGVGTGGVVVAAETKVALRGDGGDGSRGDVEGVVGAELGKPVDMLEALGDADAEELLYEGVGGGVGRVGVPVVDVGAGAVVDVDAEGMGVRGWWWGVCCGCLG